jgi:hypothetical protein
MRPSYNDMPYDSKIDEFKKKRQVVGKMYIGC